jgi:predicted ATPase
MARKARKPFVRRVRLSNYRSIATCDVALGPLVFLVGRNGSGKSNFLDALHLVADGLRETLDFALERRGGIAEIRKRSKTRPCDVSVELELGLSDGQPARYGFTLGSSEDEFRVKHEICTVGKGGSQATFEVRSGRVEGVAEAGTVSKDRLYLVKASSRREFRHVYEDLASMSFFNLAPVRMRKPIKVDSGRLLAEDGSNIGAVIARLEESAPEQKKRIEEYLAAMLPGLKSLSRLLIGSWETVKFKQDAWEFDATNMSDGTLRALGVLVAVLGRGSGRLVGIEESEIALHPAAFGLLRDALREGAEKTQILVTGQSPELLDDPRLRPEEILSVAWASGQSRIGPVGEGEAAGLREELFTAGELLRQGKLEPDGAAAQ